MKTALLAFTAIMAVGAISCVGSALLAETGWAGMLWTIGALANWKVALSACGLMAKVAHCQDMEEINARVKELSK